MASTIKINSTQELGQLVRLTRKAQKLTQPQLAAAAGVGIRFIVDLEKGKETCQMGKAFHTLHMLGIKLMIEPWIHYE